MNAILHNAGGQVSFFFVVDEQGKTSDIKIMKSSSPLFSEKVIEAVKRWQFQPATQDGEPIKVICSQRQVFKKPRRR